MKAARASSFLLAVPLLGLAALATQAQEARPPIVLTDTGQDCCYGEKAPMDDPKPGGRFFGQDAQFIGVQPAYKDNGDGTVSDLNTGLMWSKAADPIKVNLEEGRKKASALDLGGHSDWRVPNIKELYSLIDFRGVTGLAPGKDMRSGVPASAVPYLNTDYFDFLYGDVKSGERFIDSQWLSTNRYASTTMDGNETLFGVNFADGRIKGYGLKGPDGREKKFYARYVRGPAYGMNDFQDNGDGTITDRATGLMWTKADSGKALSWEGALEYARQLKLAGHEDWRLPNARELQYLVDYTRSPDTTDSPALDPVFETTAIENEAKKKDWPFFWTSTTHLDGPNASQAVYVAFGRAIGQMRNTVMDVHGAGAQRSDPKAGEPRIGHGPQGDAQRVKNFVRCVRGGQAVLRDKEQRLESDPARYPQTVRADARSYQPEAVDYTKDPGPPPDEEANRAGPGGRDGGGRSDPFIGRLDKDGDKKVSRQEFDGPPEGFEMFDKNRDGFISADEAPSGPPPGGPGGGGGPPPRR